MAAEQEKPKTAKEAKNEYLRNWRAKNREKVKEYNRRYWERKAEILEEAAER